jgi:Na+/melibiose symporter-like transporter
MHVGKAQKVGHFGGQGHPAPPGKELEHPNPWIWRRGDQTSQEARPHRCPQAKAAAYQERFVFVLFLFLFFFSGFSLFFILIKYYYSQHLKERNTERWMGSHRCQIIVQVFRWFFS